MDKGTTTPSKFAAFFTASSHSLFHQVPRALIVSAFAMICDTATAAFAKFHLDMGVVLSFTVGYMLGNIVQYVLCSLWVFPAMPRNKAVGFIAFTALALGGLGITVGIAWFAHHWYPHDQYFFHAKAVAIVLSFCWNFFSRKYLIFRRHAGDALPVACPVEERVANLS